MTLDRKAARDRCEWATDGPWSYVEHETSRRMRIHNSIEAAGGHTVVGAWWDDPEGEAFGGLAIDSEDREFIAHAREDLPAALALLDRCEAMLRHESPGSCCSPWFNHVPGNVFPVHADDCEWAALICDLGGTP